MGQIIDGKAVSAAVKQEVAEGSISQGQGRNKT